MDTSNLTSEAQHERDERAASQTITRDAEGRVLITVPDGYRVLSEDEAREAEARISAPHGPRHRLDVPEGAKRLWVRPDQTAVCWVDQDGDDVVSVYETADQQSALTQFAQSHFPGEVDLVRCYISNGWVTL